MPGTESDRITVADLLLLGTTASLLLSSRLLLVTVGLDTTKRFLEAVAPWLPPYRTNLDADRIPWVVIGVASRFPLSLTCLVRALVGQVLFATHGHRSDIRFGVLKHDDDLQAHAWVEWEGTVVIGELSDLSEYRLIHEQPGNG